MTARDLTRRGPGCVMLAVLPVEQGLTRYCLDAGVMLAVPPVKQKL